MACYKEQGEISRCIICNGRIKKGDLALLTHEGLVCNSLDCLFEFATECATTKDFLDYIKEDQSAFLEFFFNQKGLAVLPSF